MKYSILLCYFLFLQSKCYHSIVFSLFVKILLNDENHFILSHCVVLQTVVTVCVLTNTNLQ